MSEATPPEYYFNGIEFNSLYFKESNEPLTKDESDARYLIKIQPDTATALQTFSDGLTFSGEINGPTITASTTMKSNAYQSTSINQLVAIGNNQTGVGATMTIGCNVARNGNINIANTQTTGTANIVIGSNALTTGSQSITFNRPLTIGYTVNPTSLSQIGGSVFINGTTQSYGAGTTGSSKTLAVLNNIPIGIYQLFYNISTTITVATAVFTERITTVSDRVDDTNIANVFNLMIDSDLLHQTRIIGHNFTITGGGVFVNTTANDSIYLNQRFIYTAGPTITATGHLRIVRIG
jgi:hypothetical protein